MWHLVQKEGAGLTVLSSSSSVEVDASSSTEVVVDSVAMGVMVESSSPVIVALSVAVCVISTVVELDVTVAFRVELKKLHEVNVGLAVSSKTVRVPTGKLHEQNVDATEKGPLDRLLRRLQFSKSVGGRSASV